MDFRIRILTKPKEATFTYYIPNVEVGNDIFCFVSKT